MALSLPPVFRASRTCLESNGRSLLPRCAALMACPTMATLPSAQQHPARQPPCTQQPHHNLSIIVVFEATQAPVAFPNFSRAFRTAPALPRSDRFAPAIPRMPRAPTVAADLSYQARLLAIPARRHTRSALRTQDLDDESIRALGRHKLSRDSSFLHHRADFHWTEMVPLLTCIQHHRDEADIVPHRPPLAPSRPCSPTSRPRLTPHQCFHPAMCPLHTHLRRVFRMKGGALPVPIPTVRVRAPAGIADPPRWSRERQHSK